MVKSARPASAVMTVAAMCGGPGRGTARPAALSWRRTQGPPRASVGHQRFPEADSRGTLATERIIFRVQMAGGPWGWLGGAAEPQLGHGVAVRGPSQKAGGLLGARSWKERWRESSYVSASPQRTFSFPLSIRTGKVGAGVGEGSEVGSPGIRRPGTGSEWRGGRLECRRSRTGWVRGAWLLVEGAWHRLEQIRFSIGWRVQGLEKRRRNLG